MKKATYFILVLSLSLFGYCKKKKATCGCDSDNIEVTAGQYGSLAYLSDLKQFVITNGSTGAIEHFYICDTLMPALHAIIDTNRNIKYVVEFSGNIKNYCKDPRYTYIEYFFNIELTSIKPM